MDIDKTMQNISFLDEEFSQLNTLIQNILPSKIFILVDENTHEFCLPTLLSNLEIDIPFEIIEIEAGEDNKNINTAVQLWEILAEFEADRNSLLINLGGGVISDIGGFIASTYKRGIKFINIPTTLLAMVDASIGGKTGIDHLYLKNIIGTFAQPESTLLYPKFLKTLDFRELRSGFAEMLKHGLIYNQKHWFSLTSLSEITPKNIVPFISESINIKHQIVQQDFEEKNIRKTLNFGHTIGHSIESLFLKKQQPILHGKAVSVGIIIEAYISYLEGLISEEETIHIIQNIQKFFPYIPISGFSDEEIISIILQDKKNSHGKLNFSLLIGIGKATYNHQTSLENIILALNFYKNI